MLLGLDLKNKNHNNDVGASKTHVSNIIHVALQS